MLTPDEYAKFIGDAFVDERVAGTDAVHCVIVEGAGRDDLPAPGSLPVVVIAMGDRFGGSSADGQAWADAVIGPDDVDELIECIDIAPLAATSLCIMLRAMPSVSNELGLALESAVYSMLQAGPEFASWRASTPRQPHVDIEPTVRVERVGGELTVWLHRPQRHNAISAQLRDELTDALRMAVLDDSIVRLVLRGDGPSFCSGGDLAEFGDRSDPANAHAIRLARSPARQLLRLTARTTAQLHGLALGGGLELAAFASRVEAHPDTRMGLPELRLGLIPGAGGTVSLTRRIGRQRTAVLALSCRQIDVSTAMNWGLVNFQTAD